jgi:hypothetical protein
MAEHDRTRGYRDKEASRRTRPQPETDDPLAELARLIGQQNDQEPSLASSQASPQAPSHASSYGQPAAPSPYDDEAPVSKGWAPPSFVRRNNEQRNPGAPRWSEGAQSSSSVSYGDSRYNARFDKRDTQKDYAASSPRYDEQDQAGANYADAQYADEQYGYDQYPDGQAPQHDRQYDRQYADEPSEVENYAADSRYDAGNSFADPHVVDPNYGDPRYADPNYGDPRYADQRYSDGYADDRYAQPNFGPQSHGAPSFAPDGYARDGYGQPGARQGYPAPGYPAQGYAAQGYPAYDGADGGYGQGNGSPAPYFPPQAMPERVGSPAGSHTLFKKPRNLVAILSVLALAVIGTASAFGFRAMFGGTGSPVPPPVIKADTQPSKIVPATDPNNKPIQDRIGVKTEKIVPRQEEPVQQAAPGQPSRTIAPFLAGQNPQSFPPAAANVAPPAEPKRIKTVPIKPQSATEAPAQRQGRNAAAPAEQSAAADNRGPVALTPTGSVPRQNAREAHAAVTPDSAPFPKPIPPSGGTSSAAPGPYAVQVTSQRTEADAQASFRSLQQQFPSVLGNRQPVIRRADLGERGTYYRAQIPFSSQSEANQFCSSLKSAGGQCVVQRN